MEANEHDQREADTESEEASEAGEATEAGFDELDLFFVLDTPMYITETRRQQLHALREELLQDVSNMDELDVIAGMFARLQADGLPRTRVYPMVLTFYALQHPQHRFAVVTALFNELVNTRMREDILGLFAPQGLFQVEEEPPIDYSLLEDVPLVLNAEELDRMPAHHFGLHDDAVACAICLADLDTEDLVRDLPCNHMFHQACIDTWFTRNYKCPTCRQPAGEYHPEL